MKLFTNSTLTPYGKHHIFLQDYYHVINCLLNDNLSNGSYIKKFENSIKKFTNSKYCLSFSSATTALHSICLALDADEESIVWTSSISFIASANCARYSGSKVKLLDINLKTGNLDVEYLERSLYEADKNNRLPKILICVHLAGNPCELRKISILCKKYGIYLVEDASHALGAKYKSNMIGDCKFSDASIFSLHPVKVITSGEGGLITTNSDHIFKKLLNIRSHYAIRNPDQFSNQQIPNWYYEISGLGFNYRLSSINAALGYSQLKSIKRILKYRNKVFKWYYKNLPNEIELITPISDSYSTFHLIIILLKNRKERDDAHEKLLKHNITSQLHYWPIHKMPIYLDETTLNDARNSVEWGNRALSLPIWFGIKYGTVRKVCRLLSKL